MHSEVLSLKESLASRESSTRSVQPLEHIILQLKEELASAQAEIEKMVIKLCVVKMHCLGEF